MDDLFNFPAEVLDLVVEVSHVNGTDVFVTLHKEDGEFVCGSQAPDLGAALTAARLGAAVKFAKKGPLPEVIEVEVPTTDSPKGKRGRK